MKKEKSKKKKQKEKKIKIVCRNTKEVISGTDMYECYQRYLATNHWRHLRQQMAYRNNNLCQMCHEEIIRGFHIHHLTYENIGNEKYEDLLFLCEKCHDEIHNGKITKYKTGIDLEAIARKNPKKPQGYIKTNDYKNKTLANKVKYMVQFFDDSAAFTFQEQLEIVKLMEDMISRKKLVGGYDVSKKIYK